MISNNKFFANDNNGDDDFQFSSALQGGENWEDYVQYGGAMGSSNFKSDDQLSEIVYEKPHDAFDQMELESINPDFDFSEFYQDMSSQDPSNFQEAYTPNKMVLESQNPDFDQERSECCHSEEEMEEDIGSISTRDSRIEDDWLPDENQSGILDDTRIESQQAFELETDLNGKAMIFLNSRPDEEKRYILQIMPFLIGSLKEIYIKHRLPLTQEIVNSMLTELIYSKELLIGAERTVLRDLVGDEMEKLRQIRPDQTVTDDQLMLHKRKEKKSFKGNKNSSNMNHLNENYVSNIFQFAKRNYPDDKVIQRIGNERNVSAANFRTLMTPRLSDDIMTRKAKARLVGSGKELVQNIEYWMRDGYFEQCAEREKYIWRKEKALRDLALAGHY